MNPLTLRRPLGLVGQPPHGSPAILPMHHRDRGALLCASAPDIDARYPRGASKLSDRLDDVVDGKAGCLVAWWDGQPIGFAVDSPKGPTAAKLSTLWVAGPGRRAGVASDLLLAVLDRWQMRGVETGWGTVRLECAGPFLDLGNPLGFQSIAVARNRYGIGEDELVLGWGAEPGTQSTRRPTPLLAA